MIIGRRMHIQGRPALNSILFWKKHPSFIAEVSSTNVARLATAFQEMRPETVVCMFLELYSF